MHTNLFHHHHKPLLVQSSTKAFPSVLYLAPLQVIYSLPGLRYIIKEWYSQTKIKAPEPQPTCFRYYYYHYYYYYCSFVTHTTSWLFSHSFVLLFYYSRSMFPFSLTCILSACPPVKSVCVLLFTCLSVCLFRYATHCLSIVCLSVCLSRYATQSSSVLFVCQSLCLSVSHILYLFSYLSFHLYIYLVPSDWASYRE